MNTRVAIPNTTEEVRYQIRLDPEIPEHPSFVYGDGGGGRISYCLVAEHLQGRKLNRDGDFYKKGAAPCFQEYFDLCCELLMLLQCKPVANPVDLVVPVEPLFVGQANESFDKFVSP